MASVSSPVFGTSSAHDPIAVFRPPSPSTRPAWITLVLAIIAAIVIPSIMTLIGIESTLAQSVRLFSLMMGAGPLVWLLFQAMNRRARIILTPQATILKQPLPVFDRMIPHHQIAVFTLLPSNRIALIWLKPPRMASSDNTRPPKPRLLLSTSVDEPAVCQSWLQHYIAGTPGWSVDVLYRYRHRRAILRRILMFLVSPLISFILITTCIRLIFAAQHI